MADVLETVTSILMTTPMRWLHMTEMLPTELLNRRPADKEWSATECLIHLLDTESIFPARIQAIMAGRAFPAFDPDTQGTKGTVASSAQMAKEFADRRQSGIAILQTITFSDFKRTGTHSELGIVTLDQLLHEWAAHDLNHTIQAERAMMQPFIEACGPWRSYFQDHDRASR
jgi:hypothetical protein